MAVNRRLREVQSHPRSASLAATLRIAQQVKSVDGTLPNERLTMRWSLRFAASDLASCAVWRSRALRHCPAGKKRFTALDAESGSRRT